MASVDKNINHILKEFQKDEEIVGVKGLECTQTYSRRGKEIFSKGKNYKVNGGYGNTLLILTNEGYGHAVTYGGSFMKEYFQEVKK